MRLRYTVSCTSLITRKRMSKTVEQQTNLDGFPKAGELIEITSAHELETSDRAIMNILYQYAHDSGDIMKPGAEWEIAMSRLRLSTHRGGGRIKDSLERLMRVLVKVPLYDAKTGEPRVLITTLFDFFEVSRDETRPGATVRYGFKKKLQPLIAASNRWGRVKTDVVCAMTSKYAIALYELVQLRAGLDKCVETFDIDRFRELMGVPPGKLNRGPDLERFCVQPALMEVNGLSDLTVQVELARKHSRAPIHGVTIAWWPKEGDAFRDTYKERQRPKVGRLARLRGRVVETVL